jgi:hypothetical protein
MNPTATKPTYKDLQRECERLCKRVRVHPKEIRHKPGQILKFSNCHMVVAPDGSYRRIVVNP